jgi:hypothetical protein
MGVAIRKVNVPIFQLGIEVSNVRSTDIIVRVEAGDVREAQKIAIKAVHERAFSGDFDVDDVNPDSDWVIDRELEVQGVSDDDYSSLDGYSADIDLTKT